MSIFKTGNNGDKAQKFDVEEKRVKKIIILVKNIMNSFNILLVTTFELL